MRPKLFSFMITLLVSSFLFSQNDDEQFYLKELNKKCAHPDIIEIEKNTNYIEIEYLCEGVLYELVIDKKNDAVFSETAADTAKITLSMMKKINKKYPGWTIDEYNQVIFNDTTLMKVELVKDGVEQNLYFTLSGKIFKAKNFLASDCWNSSYLLNNLIYDKSPYPFFKPDDTYEMPEILKEISGIALDGAGKIYCIQDEIGSVFLFDKENEEIENIFHFSDVGDFEDVTLDQEGNIYSLRSDGMLFSLDTDAYPEKIRSTTLPLQTLNVEGIWHEATSGSFLLSSHDGNINDSSNTRNIYRYDPKKKSKNLFIEFTISVDSINYFFKQHFADIKVSSIRFSPSAIARHPITFDYYVLSATDRMLYIVDAEKKFKAIYPLPSNLYFKPEGLCFYPNGDLLIANEGTKNGLIKANILFFKYNID